MWDVDHVQFARLLDEINAAGLTEDQLKTVGASMQLEPKEVRALLNRASARWDELKPLLTKKTPLTEEQVSEELAENGEVKAIVKMDFEEIMGQLEFVEPILDEMAERMAGDVSLSQLDYKVLFNHGDTLYLKVTAKVESDDEDEDDEDEESN